MQSRKAGKEGVELAGIIGREHARAPVIGDIVDGEARLHASQSIAAAAKGVERAAELIGFRYVFGVVDDGEGTARERQGDVERLRLGARPDGRGDNDFKGRTEIEAEEGTPGFMVVAFEDEFHIEFFRRIIRYYGANATGMS